MSDERESEIDIDYSGTENPQHLSMDDAEMNSLPYDLESKIKITISNDIDSEPENDETLDIGM